MVVLDTDHLTILQEEESAAKARLRANLEENDPREIATAIVTYEEQMRGWLAFKARAKTVSQEIAVYSKLRKHIECDRTIKIFDFDQKVGRELQRLRSQRIRIGAMDLKIAAIVLVIDATLLTRNLVDFRKVPGLKAQDWTI